MHPIRVQESSYGGEFESTPSRPSHGSLSRSLTTPLRRARTEESLHQQQPAFSRLISSPPPPATAATPTPVALPVPLLPFHRAFQQDGWRIAINTPEDRWSGRHVVTSIYALLWLKSPTHILNYSSDRHWVQKIRHMMQLRNAASISEPNSRATSAALPTFSEEAEFSLAHALHLPHTVIYTRDRSERPESELIRLSSFPEHIWQRHPEFLSESDESSDPSLAPFRDCAIHPSVWYFSRHAVQGQNEILRKNKPQNKQEHLDMLRKVFLKSRPSSAANRRPISAKPHAQTPAKRQPSTDDAPSARTKENLSGRFLSLTRPPELIPAPPPPTSAIGTWADTSSSQLATDERLGGLGDTQTLLISKVDVVAQYMSLDHTRGTHVSFLQRRDMEEFIRAAASSSSNAAADSNSRPNTSSDRSSRRPTTGQLTEQQRKERVRQSLYSDLYNEMDIIPLSGGPEGEPFAPTVAAVGTKPRPANSPAGFDPLSLHTSAPPTRSAFAQRQIVSLLQQFVAPAGEHAEVLRVEWREELVAEFASKAREARARRREVRALERRLEQTRARRDRRAALSPGVDGTPTSDIEEEDEDALAEEEQEAQLGRAASEAAFARSELHSMDEKRTVCYISRRLNANPLRSAEVRGGARDPNLYDRVCCFGYSDTSPPVIDSTVMNGVLYTRLSYVCDILSQHISSISSGNLQPNAMTLFFQIDEHHNLHLLWCDRLVYWHEQALIDGPEHPISEPATEEKQETGTTDSPDGDDDADDASRLKARVGTESPLSSESTDVVGTPPDWSTFDFANFPSPSPMSELMSEALQGRYHKLVGDQLAALNVQSLKDEPDYSGAEDEEEDAQPAPETPPEKPEAISPRLSLLQQHADRSSPSTSHTSNFDTSRSSIISIDDDEDSFRRDSIGEFTIQLVDMKHHSARGHSIMRPSNMPTLTEAPDESDEANRDNEKEDEVQVVQPPAPVASPDSDSEMIPPPPTAESVGAPTHSSWADEILYEFARKRQAERNHFRRQEASYEEDRVKKTNLFRPPSAASTTPSSPTPGTPAARAQVSAPPKRGKHGINLLDGSLSPGARPPVGISLLNTTSRREISSPAAFLLAKQQKMYGGGPPLTGAKSLRTQLAAGTEILPSTSKSGWEGRGLAGLRRERQLAEAAAQQKAETLNYRQRQVALLAPPSEHERTRAEAAAKEASLQAERDARYQARDFQARVREQFDANSAAKPLRASASLSALGAAVTSSNLRTLGRSASSSSFAPPKVPRNGDDDEGDDPDDTFMTAAPLSPRALTAHARNPAPLNAASTQVTLAGTVPQGPSVPLGYFTCPKCRLNMQIHSVHSTMVVDILGEYGRMCQFMRSHRGQFNEQIKWNFRRRGAGKGKANQPPSAALEEYFDLTYYKENAIPPTIAFVFPHMSQEAYLHYREDPSFLRSTIDLCYDCHLLVRVPLMPGTEQEAESTSPLDLADGASSFFNPDTESLRMGQGHSSIMSRQGHRALDQEVEDRSFAAELAAQEQARRDRAPGEVDPHSAAAGLVPLDIRRLNQNTVDLLAHIPYNDLEIAEFERKRAEEEAAADAAANGRADKAKTAQVARVLEKYKRTTAAAAEQNGHITANTPMTPARRAIQEQLLSAAGVHMGGPSPSIHSTTVRPASALVFAANPFMRPRTDARHNRLAQVASTNSLRGADDLRRRAQTERVSAQAHLDESASPLRPSTGMSRYDPDLVSSMGGVVVSPAADAALVQSVRRRAETESLITGIVSSSARVRAEHAQSAADDRRFGPLRRHGQSSAAAFAPLYAQLTAPKRLTKPVDHVALEMEAHAAARVEFRTSRHPSTIKNTPDASHRSPGARANFNAASPRGLTLPPSTSSLHDLALPISVVTPSPYGAPNILTVAHNRGKL